MVRGHKYGVPSARTCSGAQIITESRPFPGVNLRDFECRSRQMPRPASSAVYAPKKFWPQTRIVRPLIALAAGEAKNVTASAMSCGWPPCVSELRRRPTSRGPIGIAAVIAVSMKPGDRQSVVSGKSVSVRVDLVGRRIIKKHTRDLHISTKDVKRIKN